MALTTLFSLLNMGVLLVIYFIVTSLLSWYRLHKFPGTFLSRFSYIPMIKIDHSGRPNELYADIAKRYGPLFVIGPNDLLTSDPELLRRMSMARSPYVRSGWYKAITFDPYVDSSVSTLDTRAHDRLKAKIIYGYGGKENPKLEMGVDSQLESLVHFLRERYAKPGRQVDLARIVQYFALDSISRIAYGREFGYMENDADVLELMTTMSNNILSIQLFGDVPWLRALFLSPLVLKLIGPKRTDKKGMGKLMGLAQEVVGERFEPGAEDRQDMLGSFIRHGLTQRECESEVLTQMVAGSDTTSTAIRMTMLYIMTAPRVYVRLRDEIDTAIADKKVSQPITVEEAKSLPYLQAVISEGLRIHPPFTGLAMKQVPPSGDVYAGHFLPGGTRIGQNIWAAVRDPDVFGPDVEVFRPERWLDPSADKLGEMEKTVDLVFGYGRWGCAGKSVAFMELNKFYVEMLRRFEFQLVDPKKALKSRNHNLFLQSDMWVMVTER